MTHQEGPHQEGRSEQEGHHKDHQEVEDCLEEDSQEGEYPLEEEDFPAEGHLQDRQEEDLDINMAEPEQQTSWWETHLKYSREYEQKLSLSLLFEGSMQALTENVPSSPTPIKRAYSSSRTFRGTMWPNGFNR